MTQRTVQILSASLFIAVLLWGLWTLFFYLGVPVHGAVLLPQETLDSLNALCQPTAFICRGVYGFFPFITHTLTRVPFLAWYAVTCAVLYGAFLGWRYFRSHNADAALSMSPWKLTLLFFGMVWLLFTFLSLSQNGNLPMRSIVEPRPEVYEKAGEEALLSLQENYQSLKDRGCLRRIGTFANVAEASEISMRCLQTSFFTRVLPPMIVLLMFAFELLVAGRFLLRRARLTFHHPLSEFVVSLGFGAGAWIIVLWIGAVAGIYHSWFGWGLALLIPVVAFRDAQYWIDRFLASHWEMGGRWFSPLRILTWFLLTYLAFNYLNVVRPFPIGWDDLGSYLNRPRLLVSYGTFVHSMPSFQWEYLTSLGFLLFGFESTFGATTSLMVNWFAGLLAVLSVFLFGRMFMGPGRGVLAATLYYTLPLVGHFSFADMKIDNAVFSMGALATFCVFHALFTEHEHRIASHRWILLAGIFAGLTFSMKVTGIMVFMTLAAVIAGSVLHWVAFPAAALLVCALFIQQGTLNIPKIFAKLQIISEASSPFVAFLLFGIVGVILLAVALWLRRDRIVSTAIVASMFVAGFAVTVFPWVEHNNLLVGNILPRPNFTAPNMMTPSIDVFGTHEGKSPYALGPDLAVDRSLCKATAGTEELDRYWGNAVGWGHYLTLPWRSVMNIDHAGYYVTTQPALLLFPLLLLLPFFWKSGGRYLRWLWLSTVFLLMQWVFLANGVPWYGIGVFFGLVLCVEAFVARAPDMLNRSLAAAFMTLGILICVGMRLWQYESQRNLFEYAVGKVSAETLQERTIPYYDDITDIVMSRHTTMPDRPLLYRIGTFIPYFIPRNLEVIGVADHQLDMFNCLYQEKDKTKTVQRLKALGFNSIIFDLNTATIERDPNGSLHRKVQQLTEFLNSPEAGLQLVFYDPGAGIAFLLIP